MNNVMGRLKLIVSIIVIIGGLYIIIESFNWMQLNQSPQNPANITSAIIGGILVVLSGLIINPIVLAKLSKRKFKISGAFQIIAFLILIFMSIIMILSSTVSIVY